jgi:hypothetical protein
MEQFTYLECTEKLCVKVLKVRYVRDFCEAQNSVDIATAIAKIRPLSSRM